MTKDKLVEQVAEILLAYKQGGGSANCPRYDVAKQLIPIIQADTQREIVRALKDKGLRTAGSVRHKMVWECVELVESGKWKDVKL